MLWEYLCEDFKLEFKMKMCVMLLDVFGFCVGIGKGFLSEIFNENWN